MLSVPLFRAYRVYPPYLTLLLAAGVVITTTPQFFLSEVYDTITGTLFGLDAPHYLTLPLFSHSPRILVPHAVGNLLVLLLFGALSELVLGSRRFALLTLFAAALSLGLSYARGLSEVHGVSGVGWAYHVPALLALFAVWEQRSSSRLFLRDPLVWLYGVFLLLDYLALPVLEVVVLGWGFFENFGQVQHLAATVLAVPFVFAWRRRIEASAAALNEEVGVDAAVGGPPGRRRSWSMLPEGLVILLVVVNLVGTVDAVVATVQEEHAAGKVDYSLEPPPETAAGNVGDRVVVRFTSDVDPDRVNLRRRSIWYEGESPPQLDFSWSGARTLHVELSRPLREGEGLLLVLDVYREGPRGVPLPVTVRIAYGDR
mgnify:CR=1 FL=1